MTKNAILIILLFILESFFSINSMSLKERFKHITLNSLLFLIGKILLFLFTGFLLQRVDQSVFKGYGFLNQFELDNSWRLFSVVVIFDFLVFIQHIISHKINFLWRLHSVHHSDEHLDFSSAVRFHPIELTLSFFYKLFFLIVFGVSVSEFLFFEMILGFFALFTHANIFLPKKLDIIIRSFFITPLVHQVHHSDKNSEMNSNFGTIFSIWDRLFRCFTPYEDIGPNFKLGLKNNHELESERKNNLFELLISPFR